MTRPILILGTTAYADVFIDSFESTEGVCFEGCVENIDQDRCSEVMVDDLPIYWFENLSAFQDSHDLICVLATTRRDHWIMQMGDLDFSFATLVHSNAIVSKRTSLGEGSSIDVGTVIAGFSTISPHVRVGRRVSVGHHTTIGSFSTLHPGCVVSGNCNIGSKVTIGTGAIVQDGVSVGDRAVIAAGAIVRSDVAQGDLFAGNPGKTVRRNYGPI